MTQTKMPPAIPGRFIRAILDQLVTVGALPAGARERLLPLIDAGGGDGPLVVYDKLVELVRETLADMALAQLDTVHAPGDIIELASLSPNGEKGMPVCCGRLGDKADRAAMRAWLVERIGWKNLYHGLQPRKAKSDRHCNADGVSAHVCVPLDLDFKGRPDDRASWLSENTDRLKATGAAHTGS